MPIDVTAIGETVQLVIADAHTDTAHRVTISRGDVVRLIRLLFDILEDHRSVAIGNIPDAMTASRDVMQAPAGK